MRLQFEVHTGDTGVADPAPPEQATALIERIRDRMAAAGLSVSIGSDEADVAPGEPDWEFLTPEERSAGGFTYPELLIDGPAGIAVSVFKRSVYFSSEPDFGDEQAAAAQVVTAVRALDSVAPIPAEVTALMTKWAAELNVAPDGSIRR